MADDHVSCPVCGEGYPAARPEADFIHEHQARIDRLRDERDQAVTAACAANADAARLAEALKKCFEPTLLLHGDQDEYELAEAALAAHRKRTKRTPLTDEDYGNAAHRERTGK